MNEMEIALVRMQIEFYKKGLLVVLKSSDQKTFEETHPEPSKLLEKNEDLLKRFGLSVSRTDELIIRVGPLMGLFADFMLKQDAADSHSHNDIEKLSAGLSFLSASSAEDQVCLYLLSVRLAKEGAPQNIGHLSELAAGNPSRISEVLQDKASVDDFIRSCS